MYEFAKHEVKRSQKKSKEGARRQIIRSANHSAFPEDKKSDLPIRLLWQDIQVVPTNQIHRSNFHTDQISVPTNLIRMKVRPKDLIGWDGNLVRMKVRPKDLIGRDGNLVRMKV